MISVLIPVYNYNVINLAKTLNEQCKNAEIHYEIVCYDDFSEPGFRETNRDLDQEIGISYLELSENYGRAKIRNVLAKNARFDNLLFVDCDSEIENTNFIENYIEIIEHYKICYGGRIYQKKSPDSNEKILHWKYGQKKESQRLRKRLKKPYRSFQTNNFLIKRDLMIKFPFDESIEGYGYEDLVLAEKIKDKGIPIMHIDNPLIHKGIEFSKDFIQKSLKASQNLAQLYVDGKIIDTKLIQFHHKLKKIGFNSLLHKFIQRRVKRITKNLNSSSPSLLFFDLLKYSTFLSKLNEITASSS